MNQQTEVMDNEYEESLKVVHVRIPNKEWYPDGVIIPTRVGLLRITKGCTIPVAREILDDLSEYKVIAGYTQYGAKFWGMLFEDFPKEITEEEDKDKYEKPPSVKEVKEEIDALKEKVNELMKVVISRNEN